MNTIWIAIAAMSLLDLAFGAIPGYALRRSAAEDDLVAEKIDEILSQSQYDQCGYPGCRLYVEVISCSGEKTSRCTPGGEAVMLEIAKSLNVESQPLDGEAQKLTSMRVVAVIDENNRIGCTKYIQACPVDTIVGATCTIHTVMSDLHMGYNLCADPCPMHRISLQPVAETPDSWEQDLSTIPACIIPVEHHVQAILCIQKKQNLGF